MEHTSTVRFAAATLIPLLLITSACSSPLHTRHEASSAALQDSLRPFLQALDKNKTTRFIAAFSDLDGDGTPEAIVYLLGREWCGSAGCNTLILKRDSNSWEIVTNIRITRPPIAVLGSKSNGWHNISVHVKGGGVQRGYEAELRFNGQSYPKNPSIPPARRVKTRPAEEIVITSTSGAVALYPAR